MFTPPPGGFLLVHMYQSRGGALTTPPQVTIYWVLRGQIFLSNITSPKSIFLALHFVLFLIINILQSKYRGFAPVYQNSPVFTIETRKNSQVPLLINNIPVKHQRLTSMFNIRYGGLRNQKVSWKLTYYS